MRQRVLAAVLALVFVSTPVFGQKPGSHFMWKVEGPGGSTAYLLGSLLVLTAEYYPLSAAIMIAGSLASSRSISWTSVFDSANALLMVALSG